MVFVRSYFIANETSYKIGILAGWANWNLQHVLDGSPYEPNIFFKTHLTCKLLESSNKCIINCNKMSFNHENPKSCLHCSLMQTAGPAHK